MSFNLKQTPKGKDYLDMRARNPSRSTISSQRGASLVEYSLLTMLICFVAFTSISALGNKVQDNLMASTYRIDRIGGGTESGSLAWPRPSALRPNK